MAQRRGPEEQRGHRRRTGRNDPTVGPRQRRSRNGEQSEMKRWAEWFYDYRLAATITIILVTGPFRSGGETS
jgi:hypothetical protein